MEESRDGGIADGEAMEPEGQKGSTETRPRKERNGPTRLSSCCPWLEDHRPGERMAFPLPVLQKWRR